MRNPIQTVITHAEPAFDSFGRALARALHAVGVAVESSGMVPQGKARATVTSPAESGHAYPLVVVSCVAGGPDLPDEVILDASPVHGLPDLPLTRAERVYLDPFDDAPDDELDAILDAAAAPDLDVPDLEADGYSWGPRVSRDLLHGCAPQDAADVWPSETPC